MALESVTNIDDLNASNPTATDPVVEGDDHIRNIKTALKNNFGSITGNVTSTHTELNYLDGTTLGTIVASLAVAVDSSKKVNEWLVDNITINGNDISTTNSNGDLTVSPNGSGDVDFNACSIMIDTGESIKDAGGDEYIEFTESGTPVNHLGVESADTGVNIKLKALGEADSGIIFENDQSEELMIMECVATAVNEITITNAASGNNPLISATGEADKGITFNNDQAEEMLILNAVATGVTNIQINNAISGANPVILAVGEANTGIDFENSENEELFAMECVATAVNHLQSSNAASGSAPSLSAVGGGTNINVDLIPKGTGKVDIQGGFMTSETTSLTGAGAVAITGSIHEVTTDSADAITLADGAEGQHLFIVAVDQSSGDATLTPSNPGGYATILFADDGDSVHLLFTAGKWYMVGHGGVSGGPVASA